MRVTAVESSTHATVAYDEAQELLQLRFCSGTAYEYSGVPATVHQSLLDAPSKGRYFNDAIRGRFPYRLVADSAAVRPNAEIPIGFGC